MINQLLKKHGYDESLLIEALLTYFEDIDISNQQSCEFYLDLLKAVQI